MKTIYIDSNSTYKFNEKVCATIGNFDGIHLGHQRLIDKVKSFGYKSAVITFSPHPIVFFNNLKDPYLITPFEHKEQLISKLGVDYLIVIKFDEIFSNFSKEEFVSYLKNLNVSYFVCGHDFHFGKKASGTNEDLQKEFEVCVIDKYILNGVRVSSSYIKMLLSKGNIKEVNQMLGRKFSIKGRVSLGSQKGRTIGFPTANIEYGDYYLPSNGVYNVIITINDIEYKGMCNIGNNPTFNYSYKKRLEVNVFDLNEDLYGKNVEVFFYNKIRDEIVFNSKEELTEQLIKDKIKSLELFND